MRQPDKDPRIAFNIAAVAMLSEGAAKVPGLSITRLSVRSELPPET
jgi:hypothetical protein